MRKYLDRFGSNRWTITILIILAGASAVGTVLPRAQDGDALERLLGPVGARAIQVTGFADFYHSPWFRALLGLLVVNLLACTVSRIPAMISSLRGDPATRSDPILVLEATEEQRVLVTGSLKSLGFRARGPREGSRFSRGAGGYVMNLMAHGSLLLIIVSSLAGSAFGFIATQRIHIGGSSTTAFNWKDMGEMNLPFEVQPRDMVVLPNPVSVRLQVQETGSGRKGKVITSHEGGTFRIPGLPGTVTMGRFDVDTRQFSVVWTKPDGSLWEYARGTPIGDSGLALVPVAYATWPERQVLVQTELLRDGTLIQASEISVNHPMNQDGVTIYLTDYGRDRFGFPYAGFQFVSDPAQPLVWAGCVLLLAGVIGALFIRHSVVVVKAEDGHLKVFLSTRGNRARVTEKLRHRILQDPLGNGGDSP